MATQTHDQTEAQRELADARQEQQRINERIAALEAQVRDGDEQQATEALGREWAARRSAELRAEAAEKRVSEAEAARLAQSRQDALDTARGELGAVSVDIVAAKYADALRALGELADVCEAREAAVLHHARSFADLGLDEHVVVRELGRVVIEVDGVRFERGAYQPARVVQRVVGRLARARGLRGFEPLVRAVAGVDDLEAVIAAGAGLDREAAKTAEDTGTFAALLLAAAQAPK